MRLLRRVLPVVAVAAIAATGCGKKAGLDDTEILASYDSLHGGIVFATRAIKASAGYDLYWTPIAPPAAIGAQPVVRLTDADGHEWQPSVSPGGNGIAFAREGDGIFLVNTNGRVRRISETSGTSFADSLPAVSFDGQLVAWVREDLSKPILAASGRESGFSQSYIMVANADGSDPRAQLPKEGIVQDAPRFEPKDRSYRLVWSEFDARTINAAGPQNYGIWLHDPIVKMGSFICQAPGIVVGQVQYRCFGQHLAWPVPNTIIIPQNGLEFSLDGSPQDNVQPRLVEALQTQQLGIPVIEQIGGFHRTFPISAHYLRNELMIFDGIVTSVDGDLPTLAFYLASTDGSAVRRVTIEGYTFDYDPAFTGGFFLSVATPQIIE